MTLKYLKFKHQKWIINTAACCLLRIWCNIIYDDEYHKGLKKNKIKIYWILIITTHTTLISSFYALIY